MSATRMQWLAGGVLFLSLAANAVLGAMALGHRMAPAVADGGRLKAVMQRLAALPPEQRAQAREVIRSYRPRLREAAQDLQAARQDAFSYVRSPQYSRAEADQRFAALRDKTAALQAMGQSLVLDVADKLTVEERDQLLAPKAVQP